MNYKESCVKLRNRYLVDASVIINWLLLLLRFMAMEAYAI